MRTSLPGFLPRGLLRKVGKRTEAQSATRWFQSRKNHANRPGMGEPYYITTAISYPNGRPHIGHAYEAIATDTIARFHRLAGQDVYFMTGTDEHGLKMAQTARAQEVEPRALADEM